MLLAGSDPIYCASNARFGKCRLGLPAGTRNGRHPKRMNGNPCYISMADNSSRCLAARSLMGRGSFQAGRTPCGRRPPESGGESLLCRHLVCRLCLYESTRCRMASRCREPASGRLGGSVRAVIPCGWAASPIDLPRCPITVSRAFAGMPLGSVCGSGRTEDGPVRGCGATCPTAWATIP